MRAADPIARIDLDFGLSASASAEGGTHGLSAGLWRFCDVLDLETESAADQACHIITPILTGRVEHELHLDGRMRYCRPLCDGIFNLVRVGEKPRAIMRDANFTAMLIFLPDRLIQNYAHEGTSLSVELLPIGCEQDTEILRLARAIFSEMTEASVVSSLMLDGLSLQLAAHMIRNWSNLRGQRAKLNAVACDWRVRRTIDDIEGRLASDIRLAELANEVGLTERHYASLFRAATGLPPHRWLMKRRIERACDMLIDPRRSITDIALELGFASSQHFATVFRKYMGATPSAYRWARLS